MSQKCHSTGVAIVKLQRWVEFFVAHAMWNAYLSNPLVHWAGLHPFHREIEQIYMHLETVSAACCELKQAAARIAIDIIGFIPIRTE